MYSSINALLFSFLVAFFGCTVRIMSYSCIRNKDQIIILHYDTYMVVMFGAAVSSSKVEGLYIAWFQKILFSLCNNSASFPFSSEHSPSGKLFLPPVYYSISLFQGRHTIFFQQIAFLITKLDITNSCRPHFKNVPKLIISFGTSAIMIAWTFVCKKNKKIKKKTIQRACFFLYPSPNFNQLAITVLNMSSDDEFLAFGALFQSTPEHVRHNICIYWIHDAVLQKNSILQMGIVILPTYFISYGIFIACIVQIRRLLSVGVQLSPRTIKLQRNFLLMMVLLVRSNEKDG